MTVIATDGRSMAGDSLTTAHGQIVAYTQKVIRLSDGRIAGTCGDTTDCRKLARWLDKGGDKPSIGDDCEALVLSPDGTVLWIDKEFEPLEYIAPMGIGSGGDIAIGAMLAGASPGEAAKIAISRLTNCGGEITVLGFEKLKAVA